MAANVNETVKNSAVSVAAQVITLLMHFVGRRVFVHYLDIEYLGYLSLFSNIFSILGFAELGIGGIITYHLYREVARDNREEIGKLMEIYKRVYQLTACLIAALGGVLCIFLPHLVKDAGLGAGELRALFIMQLASVAAGYLLMYRRNIYVVNQRHRKLALIDLVCTLAAFAVQMLVLVTVRSFLPYYLVSFSFPILGNIYIAVRYGKDYPYLKGSHFFTKEDLKKRNIFRDVSNYFAHRIATIVYSGTDNIVISSMCGIRQVALYSNYYAIQNSVIQLFFYKLLDPLQAAIGNTVYRTEDRSSHWRRYKAFDIFSFYFAVYIAFGFLIFFQPVIVLWMGGEEYLLDYSFVIVHAITMYFSAVFEILWKYRSTFGEYEKDRGYMIAAAAANLGLSLLLARRFDVTGVQLGTLIGSMLMFAGRIKMVVGGLFRQSVKRYWARQMFQFAIAFAGGAVLVWLVGWFDGFCVSVVWQLVFRAVVWLLFPMLLVTPVVRRYKEFHYFCEYVQRTMAIIKRRLRFKNNGG